MNFQDIEMQYFISEDDQFSLYHNYNTALKNYYFYALLLYDLSDNICDGVSVEDDESVSIISIFHFFQCKALKYKEMLGSTVSLVDPYCPHELKEIIFQIDNINGDIEELNTIANTNVRSFSRIFDFQLYETSILAIAIITRIYTNEEKELYN